MPIYFTPDGMPVHVMPGMENDFIGMGYRTSPPDTLEAEPTEDNADLTPKLDTPISPVAINSATLKEMTERLGLNTNQARAIRDNRPYDGVEDLIALMPEITWLPLDRLIDYQRPQSDIPKE